MAMKIVVVCITHWSWVQIPPVPLKLLSIRILIMTKIYNINVTDETPLYGDIRNPINYICDIEIKDYQDKDIAQDISKFLRSLYPRHDFKIQLSEKSVYNKTIGDF